MADSTRSKSGSGPVLWVVVLVMLLGIAWLGVRRLGGAGGLLGDSKSSKPAPPPSDVIPEAPGPDNTIQRAAPLPDVPVQPPSPIESQKDLSKKPKENK